MVRSAPLIAGPGALLLLLLMAGCTPQPIVTPNPAAAGFQRRPPDVAQAPPSVSPIDATAASAPPPDAVLVLVEPKWHVRERLEQERRAAAERATSHRLRPEQVTVLRLQAAAVLTHPGLTVPPAQRAARRAALQARGLSVGVPVAAPRRGHPGIRASRR